MFSDTAWRIGWRLSGAAPSTCSPFFSASACSNERLRSFWMASVYWLPPTAMSRLKTEVAALHHVDVHDGGADVQERHHAARVDPVVDLVAVLEGEDVHVHDRGVPARLRDRRRVLADLVLLDRDEQHVHVPARAAALDDLVVEGDVLDVERDVLLRLPVDGLRELLGAHLREADLLDDDGVAGDAGGHVARLDLVLLEQALDRVDHGPGVHDRAVHDRLGGQRLDPDVQELVLVAALAADLELHRLHGRGADVDADQSLLLAEKAHGRLLY